MLQCSGNSSVFLISFPVKDAAAVSVQTLFRETPISGLLGRALRGFWPRWAALQFGVAPFEVVAAGQRGRGGGTAAQSAWKGTNVARAAC